MTRRAHEETSVCDDENACHILESSRFNWERKCLGLFCVLQREISFTVKPDFVGSNWKRLSTSWNNRYSEDNPKILYWSPRVETQESIITNGGVGVGKWDCWLVLKLIELNRVLRAEIISPPAMPLLLEGRSAQLTSLCIINIKILSAPAGLSSGRTVKPQSLVVDVFYGSKSFDFTIT